VVMLLPLFKSAAPHASEPAAVPQVAQVRAPPPAPPHQVVAAATASKPPPAPQAAAKAKPKPKAKREPGHAVARK
jgi:hypothetical protein